MRQFYDTTQKLKDLLIGDADINTVTIGNLSEVDLDKQTIFPLAHIIPDDVTTNGRTLAMSFTIVICDMVNQTREEDRDQVDPFHGSDNLQDIWNTMLTVGVRMSEEFRRGDTWTENYEISETNTLTPFQDRFTNLLAGWVIDVTITVPNTDMSLC